MSCATARAHANIALVKYWGKRDRELNLPAAGSLSLTLAALTTTTEVEFDRALARDTLVLDGEPDTGGARDRVSEFLDLVRAAAGMDARARVVSGNDFPTASGLASSASAFAALALAATSAAELVLAPAALSVLARRGSGSAARSLFGGAVLMEPGTRGDGEDACARSIDDLSDWPLCMVIAIVGGGAKKRHSSRDAMDHCANTSPLYQGFLDAVPGDIWAARAAIAARDLGALGAVAEHSALAMHAAAMASRPPILYFQAPTLACMHAVHALRDGGTPGYFTMDAGPHVKVLTLAEHAPTIARALDQLDGVGPVFHSAIGGAAELTQCP